MRIHIDRSKGRATGTGFTRCSFVLATGSDLDMYQQTVVFIIKIGTS